MTGWAKAGLQRHSETPGISSCLLQGHEGNVIAWSPVWFSKLHWMHKVNMFYINGYMELAEAIREVMDTLAFPLLFWSLQFKSFCAPEYQLFKIEDYIGTEISHEAWVWHDKSRSLPIFPISQLVSLSLTSKHRYPPFAPRRCWFGF